MARAAVGFPVARRVRAGPLPNRPPAWAGRPKRRCCTPACCRPASTTTRIEDLLKVGGNPARDFGGGADTQLDDLGAERRANAAALVASQAVAQLAMWSPCAATAPDCKQQIIDTIGMRAFRHPLSAVERQQLTALFDAGVKEKDFATGVEWFLTGLLQSPDFLYQFARPAAGEQAGSIRPLSGYEMASRLSYFVWDSMPDAPLFDGGRQGRRAGGRGRRGEAARPHAAGSAALPAGHRQLLLPLAGRSRTSTSWPGTTRPSPATWSGRSAPRC